MTKDDGMEHLDVVGLLKAAQILERNMTVALMYSGLRIPQFRLLEVLAATGQATVTEMSERLQVTRATASVMINELIKSGLVAMAENPADRRSFHIHVTEMGVHKLGVARNDVAVFCNRLSASHSPAAIRVLNEFASITTTKVHDAHPAGSANAASPATPFGSRKRSPDGA
jgi:DNA-binding MarR family transcriptional regulator